MLKEANLGIDNISVTMCLLSQMVVPSGAWFARRWPKKTRLCLNDNRLLCTTLHPRIELYFLYKKRSNFINFDQQLSKLYIT